jgi:hypothetical protein
MIGIATFAISMVFALIKIHRANPNLLRRARIQIEKTDRPTTFDWQLILAIFTACFAFAGATFIFSNAMVFVAFGRWYIDAKSVGILAIVFMIFAFQGFDGFITKYLIDSKNRTG